MTFDQQSNEWYYSLKAMDEAINLKQHHALFVLNNYRNIQNGNYDWIIEPIDEKVLKRIIHADVISQVFKSIESLFTIINVGLTAYQENDFSHSSMKETFFKPGWGPIQNNLNNLLKSKSIQNWKWALWISDVDESIEIMNLTNDEAKNLSLIYEEYLERAIFIVKYAVKFWNLFRSVRNAFSHTLQIVPSPNLKITGFPDGYDDALLVLDKSWKEGHPVKQSVVIGSRPLKITAEIITNLNLLEQSIIKNHTISIQASGKRLVPVYLIGKDNSDNLKNYEKIIKKLPKFPSINVGWKNQPDTIKELKPQFELYEGYRTKLNEFGKILPHSYFGKYYFPRKKVTK